MESYLPKNVVDEIKKHLRTAGKKAERGWESASADEDSLTGDFGAVLRRDFKFTKDGNGKVMGWSINYAKFGGRGEGAPEKLLGADGIFQITLMDGRTKDVLHKGILFQSKKVGSTKLSKLKEQGNDMEAVVPGGSCIFEFGPKQYRACDTEDILQADTIKDALSQSKQIGDYLADIFLTCKQGKMGMFYDGGRSTLFVPDETKGVVNIRGLLKHRLSIEVYKSD